MGTLEAFYANLHWAGIVAVGVFAGVVLRDITGFIFRAVLEIIEEFEG